MRTASVRAFSVVALVGLIVAGCGGDAPFVGTPQPDPGDKTGAREGPITITVVDSQPQGKPSNLPLMEFERQVASLSGGSMAVEVVADKLGDAIPIKSDAEVIDGAKRGAYQMAVVPARAWSDAGVTSLQALQAPFLIDSDEHAAAVVSDERIADQLLGGLQGSGVTGLVLFPEGLRHLFGFRNAILTPADLAGQKIRSIQSRDTDAILEALGGLPIQAEGEAFDSGIADGSIRGAESSFARVTEFAELPVATGNLTPYAKFDSLVVNDRFWKGLTDEQRTVLQDAADATRDWAIRDLPSDAEAAARYCSTGGSVELAEPAAMDAFRAAAGDLSAQLAEDPATNELMTRIREAGKGLSPEPVVACKAPIAKTIRPEGGDLPDGIYRVEYTDDYLKSWGVVDINFQHGVYTFRLDDGHWNIVQRGEGVNWRAQGIYQVDGSELYWRWDNDPGKPIDHLTWSAGSNGDLTFTGVDQISEGWTFGLPLVRVGPLTD